MPAPDRVEVKEFTAVSTVAQTYTIPDGVTAIQWVAYAQPVALAFLPDTAYLYVPAGIPNSINRKTIAGVTLSFKKYGATDSTFYLLLAYGSGF